MRGRDEVIQFLTKKWEKENGYRLQKELFTFRDNKIAVQVRIFYTGAEQWIQELTVVPLSSSMNGTR